MGYFKRWVIPGISIIFLSTVAHLSLQYQYGASAHEASLATGLMIWILIAMLTLYRYFKDVQND